MHTIKEAAEILQITPQAVYKKINQFEKELKNELKEVKRGGRTVKVLTDKGIKILRGKDKQPEFATSRQQVVNLLEETVAILNKQLEVKDKQIQELNNRLKEQQELNKNNQVLIGLEQQRALPSGTKWGKIKGIFRRNDEEE
jgi:predicted ArsR family transcriptional regulator